MSSYFDLIDDYLTNIILTTSNSYHLQSIYEEKVTSEEALRNLERMNIVLSSSKTSSHADIIFSVKYGYIDLVEELVCDNNIMTAVVVSIESGCDQILDYLATLGDYGEYIVNTAIAYGRTKLVNKYILPEHKIDQSLLGREGNIELIVRFLIEERLDELVNALIANGRLDAFKYVKNKYNVVLTENLLSTALCNNRTEIVKYIVDEGVEVLPRNLLWPVKSDNLELVKFFIEKGYIAELTTFLRGSGTYGNPKVAKFVVDNLIYLAETITSNSLTYDRLDVFKAVYKSSDISEEELFTRALAIDRRSIIDFFMKEKGFSIEEKHIIIMEYNLDLMKYVVGNMSRIDRMVISTMSCCVHDEEAKKYLSSLE